MDEEKIVIDNQTGQVINNAKPAKTSKQHPVLYLVLVAIISLSCGLAGGYVAARYTTPQTVIYKSDSQNVNPSFATDGSIQSVIASVKDSVVEINTETIETNDFYSFFGISGNNLVEGAGSGVIISKDGYIITNYHVIEQAVNNNSAKIYVLMSDGKEYDATVVGSDKTTDLAVIKVDATELTAAEFGNSDSIKVGELAVAIGNPLGQEFAGTVTGGYISGLNRTVTVDNVVYNLIQTDAAINSGNSGGPLVDASGRVIGINTVKVSATGVEGIGFAIPINEVLPIVEELISNKKVTRPFIGVGGITLTESLASRNKLVEGIYVQQVTKKSPAEVAGIKQGDVIVEANDTKVTSIAELNVVKNKLKIGDTIKLKIYRNKEYITVNVTLASTSDFE